MANGLFNLKQVVQGIQQGGWPAQKTPAVEYVVVGGGGGNTSVGGGAGGLLAGLDPVPNGQTLLVTVGAGGASGSNGSASVFGQISVAGGGFGSGNSGVPAGTGGSGGGGYNLNAPGQGVANQGNQGGTSVSTTAGGGGGGAGTVGQIGFQSSNVGGNGGAGIGTNIGGALAVYAGGGSGYGSTSSGSGGVGGGGDLGVNGTANTGGGGGANGGATSGGSGIVIVSYPDVYAAATTTTGSPTVSTSGSGSVYFDGTGDSFGVPSSANLSFGTGDFTIEGWVYLNTVSGFQTVFSIRISGSDATTGHYSFAFRNTALEFYASGGVLAQGGTASTSTWTHVACTRSSGSVRLFLNGTQVGSTASFTTSIPQNAASVASNNANTENLNGYISNLRILKGTAQYTANFTVPTAPLTAITNTQLLLNTVSGAQFADASSNSFVLTKNGDTAWNQLSPFATGAGYKNRVYTWTSSGSITF